MKISALDSPCHGPQDGVSLLVRFQNSGFGHAFLQHSTAVHRIVTAIYYHR